MQKKSECILLIGIPAIGKSTFFLERFVNTHVRINLDMLKTRHREELLVKACIEAKQSFVVDNTNITREKRQRYFNFLEHAKNFLVIGYYFDPQGIQAFDNNRLRSERRRVPDKAIWGMVNQLERPSYAEGFDKLYHVSSVGVDRYHIQPFGSPI